MLKNLFKPKGPEKPKYYKNRQCTLMKKHGIRIFGKQYCEDKCNEIMLEIAGRLAINANIRQKAQQCREALEKIVNTEK